MYKDYYKILLGGITMKKMPVLFLGHGNPMIALQDNDLTKNLKSVGEEIISRFGKPKAILAISAHWHTRGSFVGGREYPKQIYDMYHFPKELYEVKYPVKGSIELAKRVIDISNGKVFANNDWGIDHGVWSVMVHMFPKADIPITQLSVNGYHSPEEALETGKDLSILREEGYLIIGSGNVVHNLRNKNQESRTGFTPTEIFDEYIYKAIMQRNNSDVVNYQDHYLSSYAVPTIEHFYPLIYVLGASIDDEAVSFNKSYIMDTISMTSYVFACNCVR